SGARAAATAGERPPGGQHADDDIEVPVAFVLGVALRAGEGTDAAADVHGAADEPRRRRARRGGGRPRSGRPDEAERGEAQRGDDDEAGEERAGTWARWSVHAPMLPA